MQKNRKRPVICNSSPLINLCKVGLDNLLEKLFGQVIIPNAVHKELLVRGGDREHARTIKGLVDRKILLVKTPHNSDLLSLLGKDLDEGEAEVIALALEIGCETVIIDESDAREIADRYKLQKTGFIGILLKAQKEGMIPSAAPYLVMAREKGFWIEERLFEAILKEIKKMADA